MWDYEGKLEAKQWERSQGRRILFHGILSPSAKMIRLFLSKAADAIVQEVMGSMVIPEEQVHLLGPTIDLTKDVLCSPMEVKVNARVAATQADDAEVDLAIWALPEETLKQTKA